MGEKAGLVRRVHFGPPKRNSPRAPSIQGCTLAGTWSLWAGDSDTFSRGVAPLGPGRVRSMDWGIDTFSQGAAPLGLGIVRSLDWGIDTFSRGAAPLGLGIVRSMDWGIDTFSRGAAPLGLIV